MLTWWNVAKLFHKVLLSLHTARPQEDPTSVREVWVDLKDKPFTSYFKAEMAVNGSDTTSFKCFKATTWTLCCRHLMLELKWRFEDVNISDLANIHRYLGFEKFLW